MDFVSLALYGEGSTDGRFLSSVIEKTAQRLLQDNHRSDDLQIVLEVKELEEKKEQRELRMLEAARLSVENHILIVHADADKRGFEKTLQELFQPGYDLIQREQGELCRCLIPVIPVRMIEAWILADYELLLKKIGTKKKAEDLHIPKQVRGIEEIADPKQRLKDAIRLALADRPRRKQESEFKERMKSLYEAIGKSINLERLDQLQAYQAFKKDLSEAFRNLGLFL
jgi:hypothetical protein